MNKPKTKVKQKFQRKVKLVPIQLGDDSAKIIGWIEIDIDHLEGGKIIEPIFDKQKLIGFKLVPSPMTFSGSSDKDLMPQKEIEEFIKKINKYTKKWPTPITNPTTNPPWIPTTTDPNPNRPYIGDPITNPPVWMKNATMNLSHAQAAYAKGEITNQDMKGQIQNYMDIMSDYISKDVKKNSKKSTE
jgi:hypothetical protein